MDPPAFIPARESRTGEEAGFCVYKESTLEAVLERPVHDESGAVPEFNQEEWDRQIGSAGVSEANKEETTSLADILALPQPIDLWPGAVYIPPRISRLEEMIQAANQAETKWETYLGANIVEKLEEALADPERAYRVYEAAYAHCMEFYTEEAYARYLLEQVGRHNWSQPTPLDI